MNIEKFQDDDYYYVRTALKDRESKKRWARRLQSLDLSAQKKISDKYYGGTMPWKENGK